MERDVSVSDISVPQGFCHAPGSLTQVFEVVRLDLISENIKILMFSLESLCVLLLKF